MDAASGAGEPSGKVGEAPDAAASLKSDPWKHFGFHVSFFVHIVMFTNVHNVHSTNHTVRNHGIIGL